VPCIVIKTKRTNTNVDLKSLGEDLSKSTGIDINRISILVDYYNDSDILKADDNLIIFVNISENNSKDQIELLCHKISSLSEHYFNKKQNSSAVICSPIQILKFYYFMEHGIMEVVGWRFKNY
jgi:ribosomal protein S15P/S13E